MSDLAGQAKWSKVRQAWLTALALDGGEEELPGPATYASIVAAEARLGVALPQSLTDLYAVSDGLPVLGGDMYGVRGTAELVWFRDAESELIEIWDEIDSGGGGLTDDVDLMRRGLAVSKGGDEYRLLVVPNTAAAPVGPDDWGLYRQSNGGDGVTPEIQLADHLLYMLDLYYDVDP